MPRPELGEGGKLQRARLGEVLGVGHCHMRRQRAWPSELRLLEAPNLHGVRVRRGVYPRSWTRIDAKPEVLCEDHQGRGAHSGLQGRSPIGRAPPPSWRRPGRRGAEADADKSLCSLPHEGHVVELCRSVCVGDPREECLHTLLEERVARVLVVIGRGRSSHG